MEEKSKVKKPGKFTFQSDIRWLGEKRGLLSSPGKPDLQAAAPLEFGGHSGIWSPEEFFVSSVNACIMATFLHFAEKERLALSQYQSKARGHLEKGREGFMFTWVEIYPQITLKKERIEKRR